MEKTTSRDFISFEFSVIQYDKILDALNFNKNHVKDR